MSKLYSRLSAGALALVAALSMGCASDAPTVPTSPLLAGLSQVGTNDTSTSTTPPNTGPGYFRGTVMGPSLVGAGGDTLASAPRIANVRVAIYPRMPSSGGTVEAGPEAGFTVTNANGEFQLPTLPAGEYVVTFVPPESGIYRGSYSLSPLHGESHKYPWWVVLPRK